MIGATVSESQAGSTYNTIRGDVIYGGDGIVLENESSPSGDSANYTTVAGNIIGLDATGETACPETGNAGIINAFSHVTIGGSSPADRNVIAGPSIDVECMSGSYNTVQGNLIGIDKNGTKTFNTEVYLLALGSSHDLIQDNYRSLTGLRANPRNATRRLRSCCVLASGACPAWVAPRSSRPRPPS